uniref:Mu-like prophage I protein n=1 Tax=Candidatus Kentrum sp. LFY TaxID=2126342 RepID=A0A450UE55_9GAMM|nr:MAG: Mu-like prophage I protein [Candidatus Kentron sp. LFY]
MPQSTYLVSAMAVEIPESGVTSELHLLPPGPFRTVDGRPEECDDWQLDAGIAGRVIALVAARKTDILVDFEHQSLRSVHNGRRAEAAGWIPRTLEWREGGLFATDVSWVGDTAQLIREKKYRYTSTVFMYHARDGNVTDIISVALTNTPALDGLDALAELSRNPLFELEDDPVTDEERAVLVAERDRLAGENTSLSVEKEKLSTKLAALTVEHEKLKTDYDDMKKKEHEAALAREKKEKEGLIEAALKDGRLLPAQKEWAEKQPMNGLREFLKTADVSALLNRQSDGKKGGGVTLSEERQAMCNRMGVTTEEYIAAERGSTTTSGSK